MDNQEMTLCSLDGKKYVDIKRAVVGDGDPRNVFNFGCLYLMPVADDKSKMYEFGDNILFIVSSDHVDRMDEINSIAEVKLPLFVKVMDDGKANIKTDEFYGSVLAGYIFTTKDTTLMYFNDREICSLKEQRDMLQKEVRDYNNFLSGNVWSYTLHEITSHKVGDFNQEKDIVIENRLGVLGDFAIDRILENIGAKDWIIESQEIEEESLGR